MNELWNILFGEAAKTAAEAMSSQLAVVNANPTTIHNAGYVILVNPGLVLKVMSLPEQTHND